MGGESVDDEVDGQAGRCEAEGHCWVVESEGAQDREAQYILQAHKKLYFLSSARVQTIFKLSDGVNLLSYWIKF